MRDVAKLATGIAARCPSGIVGCLPWLLLLAALYGEWAWAESACEVFSRDCDKAVVVWQAVNGIAFALWCVANVFVTVAGCVSVHCREFRNNPLPAWWGCMWRPERDVRLREIILWATFAPSVTVTTLVEVLSRAGSLKIRRGRS